MSDPIPRRRPGKPPPAQPPSELGELLGPSMEGRLMLKRRRAIKRLNSASTIGAMSDDRNGGAGNEQA